MSITSSLRHSGARIRELKYCECCGKLMVRDRVATVPAQPGSTFRAKSYAEKRWSEVMHKELSGMVQ